MSVSKKILSDYEMVIGLEVHVELKTETKMFCGCSAAFGAPPNTRCCPVCTGMPGSMPVLNRKAVEYGVKAGLALNCHISEYSKFDRKNYFYPDLPKAYQISQYDKPLCTGGYLDIETTEGKKRIGITRIHLEEDAGKLIHEPGKGTLIDCNRCGVPLIEIVSEPDIRSAEEAKEYVRKLRTLLLYAGVSDCRMNEGSMRCDVNLSVRKKGETALGVRNEMKNINSIAFIGKAISYEFERQVEESEAGREILQQTRRFDQQTGKTHAMRMKESQSDYRFFPEPDLPPVILSPEKIEELRLALPEMPDLRKKRYMVEYGLSAAAAERMTADRKAADYFEKTVSLGANPLTASNLLQAEVLPVLEEDAEIPFLPERLASLCGLLAEEKISNGAARKVIAALLKEDCDPASYVKEHDLLQISDPAVLEKAAREVILSDTRSVEAYLAGKEAAAQALIGKTIKKLSGRGNPALIRQLILKFLEEKKGIS